MKLKKIPSFFVSILFLSGGIQGTGSIPKPHDFPRDYPERVLERALKDIATEEGYTFSSESKGWILELKKPQGKAFRCFGYNFPLNDCVTYALCNDKPALSIILKKEGLPHVPHTLYLNPVITKYADTQGSWTAMQNELNQNPLGIVLKVKDGTGGSGVFMVKNRIDLEAAATRIFSKGKDLCVSPLVDQADEFRVILLDKEPQLVFQKERLFVIGDGKSTLGELCLQKNISLDSLKKTEADFTSIPASGDRVHLNWKHNLGQGAEPRLMESPEDPLYQHLTDLALRAADAINLRFGSIDIMQTAHKELKILEINNGVMMENMAKFMDKHDGSGYSRAKAIYAKAARAFFGDLNT